MGVLVLGMHRSGTSALTRVLNLLGLDAGRDVLMGASESEPHGALGGRAADVVQRPPARRAGRPLVGAAATADPRLWSPWPTGSWGDEAADLHAEAFAGTPWVWKDPRVSLLLPFWRAVLGRDGAAAPHEVVALRDPTEIAGSLAARDDMALAYGLALWERYTRALLDDLDGRRACFVHYERLLAEPEGVARELVAFCADEPLSDDPERLAAVDRPPRRRPPPPDRPSSTTS